MDKKTKEMYSEVYSILNLMEEKYIRMLPKKLYELIKNNRLESYNPIYTASKSLVEQNIKRETAVMLVLLKLNYWCETENEKNVIKGKLKVNSEKHEKAMREQYSSENMFRRINEAREATKIEISDVENMQKETNKMVEYKKESLFNKIYKKIIGLVKKND